MAEYNNQQQTTFISTDNNQLEDIIEEKITFTIAKQFYRNKFNEKYPKSVQTRIENFSLNRKIQYCKDVTSY